METGSSAQDATPSAPDDSAPDWAATTADVVCPMCEYNLRGLATPRCPECGYAFRWSELLDPNRRLHPYLFEHHPERNIWSFWKTAVGGLRPWRFWVTLYPTQPSNLRRLLIYWFIAAILMTGALASPFICGAIGVNQQVKEQRAKVVATLRSDVSPTDPRVVAALDARLPLAPSHAFFVLLFTNHGELSATALTTGIAFLWPGATFVTLSIFQRSMRHAKVRSVHVLRCVLYACDVGLWVGLASAVPLGIMQWSNIERFSNPYGLLFFPGSSARRDLLTYVGGLHAVAGLMFLIAVWRLTTGYKKYLRFHLPFATVLASQLILLLLLAIVVINTSSPIYDAWFHWIFFGSRR